MDRSDFSFSRDGFEIFPLLSVADFMVVKGFALEMLGNLFREYAGKELSEEALLTYHLWGAEALVPHREMLRAKNRHTQANQAIRSLLVNQILEQRLRTIGISNFRLWDEGLGWLAFRLVRPGPGDGYPFSCKNWGPAKEVLSIWIPILGFEQNVMIHLVPGSHLNEYPKYLPTDTHFTKDEYRLTYEPTEQESLRPIMQPGQALIFHPKTLHAEEVKRGSCTRLNLEFRLEPL